MEVPTIDSVLLKPAPLLDLNTSPERTFIVSMTISSFDYLQLLGTSYCIHPQQEVQLQWTINI